MSSVEQRVVLADDEQYWRNIVSGALLVALRERDSREPNISLAEGSLQLLQEVFSGATPDIVILDNDYQQGDYKAWRVSEGVVEGVANNLEVDFNPIKKPDRGGWTVIGEMPDDLYNPNSINFGLILRFLGYGGKIIVVSSDPPEPGHILRELEKLNVHLRTFNVEINNPIDAVICKPSRHYPNDFEFATEITDQTFDGSLRWKYQRIKAESFSVAVGELLKVLN